MQRQLSLKDVGLLRHSVRTLLEVDRAQVQPWRGLRLALGVAIPLIGGIATGHEDLGAFACGGALGVGFGGFLGAYRTQAVTMMVAAACIALALFVGSIGMHPTVLAAGIVALGGFAAGLLGVFGPGAYFVGVQATLHLLLGSGFPADVHDAATRALAAFAGGSLQTLLAVGVWPWRHYALERGALAKAYRSLARYTRGSSGTLPPSLAASGIYRVLADPHPFANHREVALFQRLLDEGERIRVGLAAIAASSARANDALEGLREAVSRILDEIAAAVHADRAPQDEEQAWRVLQRHSAEQPHRIDARAGGMPGVRLPQVRRLAAQLRTAWRIAADAPPERGGARPKPAARRRRALALRETAQTLRAALTLRSSSFRHALRIALAVAVAAALSRASAQPNAYWLPITVLLVLQPAFGDTMTRGLAMMAGTVVGAVVATLIASFLHPEGWALAALIVLLAWLCFTLFRASYALFAACMTAYVVFLVSFFGLPEPVAALHRVLAILTGGCLALAAYALWPTREARLVAERLATALQAQARYARVLLDQIATPQARDDLVLRKARLDAQRERNNAEDSVERMLVEPRSTDGLPSSIALGVLAAIRTFAFAALTLEAARPDATCAPWPSLRPLARAIERRLLRIAAALRSGSRPPAPSGLRALHTRLAERPAVGDVSADVAGSECAALAALAISESDLMVDSVETIASLVDKNAGRPLDER